MTTTSATTIDLEAEALDALPAMRAAFDAERGA